MDEANYKILSLEDDADWQKAVKLNTSDSYKRYIAKYGSLESAYQGKYLDRANSWIQGRKYFTIFCVLALFIGGIVPVSYTHLTLPTNSRV